MSRRAALRSLAAGAGVAMAAGRARAQSAAEWDQTVAAAKKEGKVAVNTFTGQGYGRVFNARTTRPEWDGRWLDLGYALDVLHPMARPGRHLSPPPE